MAILRPEIVLDVLRMAVASATNIREQLILADAAEDREGLSEGASMLGSLLADTVDIIMNAGEPIELSAAQSRLPSLEWSPEELIQTLRLAIQIEEIAIDILLRDRPDLTQEENLALLDQARFLIQALGARARSTRRLIQERWPYFWTDILGIEFKKILEIRPRFGREKRGQPPA
jgi:hypothetical protein